MNTTESVCVLCSSSNVVEVEQERTINVGSYSVTISGARHMNCAACGESYQTGLQAKTLDAAVIEARRLHEGLLAAADIRRIRLSVGLSQAECEDALGIGPKTMVRWENSTGLQSKAIDDVLRLIELDSDNLRLLVRIRSAARTEMFERKLAAAQYSSMAGELETAIIEGVGRASVALDSTLTARITGAVLEALRTYKHEKIEKLTLERLSA